MIRNYLKIALRSLMRNKTFSFINIFGLAISMSICIIIIMMVADQMSYDKHIKKGDRVYRINTERLHSDEFINKYATSPQPLAEELTTNYSGIEATTTIRRGFGNAWVDFDNDVNIPVSGFFADESFFDVFEHELLYGDPRTALTEPHTAVLTKKAAEKLFSVENPIGEIIKVGELGEYKVTGVLKDTDNKSHIKFEALGSLATTKTLEADSIIRNTNNNWNNSSDNWTYVRLTEGKSVKEVEQDLKQISDAQYAEIEDINIKFYLQSITKITPGPLLGNQIGPGLPDIFVYFLGGLAMIIMISACFNYTNLSIAKALSRAKEVGIRKVSGAVKHQIFFQFISEAVVISLLALGLALGMLVVLKPAFLSMKFSQLLLWDLNTEPIVLLFCVLFSVIVGVIAGVLPALLLSSFQPIKVLKGFSNIRLFSKIGLRKSLIVAQFSLSLIFIISTTLVYNQLDMMIHADYGFNGDNVINVKLNDADPTLLKNEISNHSSIENVTASSHLPAIGVSYGRSVRVNEEDEELGFNYFSVDEDYIDNLQLHLIAGEGFSPKDIRQTPDKMIINEKMVQMLGFESAIAAVGESLIIDDSTKMTIKGIVKDYNHQAMMSELGPMALIPYADQFNMLQVRYQKGNKEAALQHIEQAWSKLNPEKKITYKDFNIEVGEFYDLIFGDLVNIIGLISFLTITISCLGLLGMATFTTETKVKEVSIRKVLGASDKNVVMLLSKGFITLLLIASVIAIPAAYFLNNLWLESIAYRVSIDFSVIGMGTGIMLILGILVIGSQTIKAAIANPAETLRSE